MVRDATKAATGPLNGVRVLDLSAVLLGPFATQILGDYGADVIKVEPPAGDLMRLNGVSKTRGMSSIFLAINRNKRSLCIDLQTAEGKAALKKLVPSCDVLVHNMRVEAIERLGFGYEAVRAMRPDIVYVAATGFDQDGPDAGKPAFDDIIQAASGLAAVASIGRDAPDYVASLIADKTSGMATVNAVLAALFHRERTGAGQYVEVPMLETLAAFVLTEHLGGLTFDPPAGPPGYARLLQGGRKPWPTKDGHFAMLPYTGKHWRAFFDAAGRSDLNDTLALDDRGDRNKKNAELYATTASITPTKTTAEWMAICEERDIPATPIYALDAVFRHPQLRAVGMFQDFTHHSEGPIVSVRPATKFTGSPASVRRGAPLLGEHSVEVLREAGLSDGEIAALVDKKIIHQRD